ncbi:helix-turn-helix domain-containing protein [Bosea sp. NBC_00550]|uniref:helix-turn-helix domain-containing protein n=1 Tax=Bosea sp. NBC_00550 TaxID=2969621 RepID=UPI002231EBCD|nr:helix-turn-helix transcriptional regulator [Bosea sp. NBC_00550]UZF93182.1 helix-turn-helix domain-containing protein [Bosea sp. NBC_00550]
MLGSRLKRWRKGAGLTLEQVAEKIGTSKGHLSDMERGMRPVSSRWLAKIAAAYDVPEAAILEDDGASLSPSDLAREQALAQFLELTPEAQADVLALMRHMPKRAK